MKMMTWRKEIEPTEEYFDRRSMMQSHIVRAISFSFASKDFPVDDLFFGLIFAVHPPSNCTVQVRIIDVRFEEREKSTVQRFDFGRSFGKLSRKKKHTFEISFPRYLYNV